MIESKFQRLLIGRLEGAGAAALNVHGHAMQARHWPDIWMSHPLVPFGCWLELKTNANPLRAGQKMLMRKLRKTGARAFCLRMLPGDATIVLETEVGEEHLARWSWPLRDVRGFLREIEEIDRNLRLSGSI